jgi:hypothetical protein
MTPDEYADACAELSDKAAEWIVEHLDGVRGVGRRGTDDLSNAIYGWLIDHDLPSPGQGRMTDNQTTDIDKLAQAAREGSAAYKGRQLADWDAISEFAKARWRSVARAVIKAQEESS